MKRLMIFPAILLLASCKEPVTEVEVTSTRPLNSADENVEVHASDDEQFLPPSLLAQIKAEEESEGGGVWQYLLPAGWRETEKSQFREVNLLFGPTEAPGEIYVTTVGGTPEANVGRWFRQFGLAAPALADLAKVPFMGKEGYFIEAKGKYEPGMQKPTQLGQALLGVVVERNDRVVTVKMVGPEETVVSERANFIKFISSLKKG